MLLRPVGKVPVILAGLFIIISSIGFTGCYFTSTPMIGPNLLTAWTSDVWVVTTQTDFGAGVLNHVDINSSPGDVKLNQTSTTSCKVYEFSGGNTQYFNVYDSTSNIWSPGPNTLHTINAGGALKYDTVNYLYALAGGNTKNFTRFSISSNSWEGRADTLLAVNAGGALAYANGYIYAVAGGNTRNFTRYNTTTNTWQGRANTLQNIQDGGALAYAKDGYIYAFAGGGSKNFTRYNPSTNTWVGRADAPVNINEGGGLVYATGDFIYAISGKSTSELLRYNISSNSWTDLSNTPAALQIGAAITYCCNGYVYVQRGSGCQCFFRYDPQTATWYTKTTNPSSPDTPYFNGPGGSLACVGGSGTSCYMSSGTIASIVFDTTTTGSRWDVLAWNASLPSGTNITFQVRASNTLFLKNAATPAWTSVTGTLVGGTYYVYYPALPVGRYLQWRATLTSGVCANTPVLHDVTVYYTDP